MDLPQKLAWLHYLHVLNLPHQYIGALRYTCIARAPRANSFFPRLQNVYQHMDMLPYT